MLGDGGGCDSEDECEIIYDDDEGVVWDVWCDRTRCCRRRGYAYSRVYNVKSWRLLVEGYTNWL